MSTVQYRSKESYHSLTSRETPVESRYAIPVAQDAILVGRNGLKTASTFVSWPKFFSDFKNRW